MKKTSPSDPDEPSLARNGKIAALPPAIRDEVNRRLDEGQRGPQVLAWLNAEKLVREVIQRHWPGKRITQQNLSAWRQGGYRHWRQWHEKVATLKELAGHALKLGEAAGGSVADGSAAIIGSKIMNALNSASLEEAMKMAKTVHRLRTGDRGRARLELQQRKLAQQDALIELERQKYRRETTILFKEWYQNREARSLAGKKGDNSAQLELLGQAIFGDDWRTEQEEYNRFRYDI